MKSRDILPLRRLKTQRERKKKEEEEEEEEEEEMTRGYTKSKKME
jgi:hypothetical protein